MLLLFPKTQCNKPSTLQELKEPKDLNSLNGHKLNKEILTSRNIFAFVFRDPPLNDNSKRSIPIIGMRREQPSIPLGS